MQHTIGLFNDTYSYNDMKRINKCKHQRKELFNEYWCLYRCEFCDAYMVCTKVTKKFSYWEIAEVNFSRNDDRIVNIWFPSFNKDSYKLWIIK